MSPVPVVLARFVLPLIAVLLIGTEAQAHELLDQAKRQADEALFQEALVTLTRAESESDLNREELIQLYLQRALVNFALQVTGAMRDDLARIAALEPDYELGEELPPAFRDAFPTDAVPLTLRVEKTPVGVGLRLQLDVIGHRPDLVRRTVLSARLGEEGRWRSTETRAMTVVGEDGAGLEYYALGYGPSDALLLQVGSEQEPRRSLITRPQPTASAARTQAPAPDDSGSTAVWWIVGGVAVAVLVGVVIGAVIAGNEADTQLSPPMVVP